MLLPVEDEKRVRKDIEKILSWAVLKMGIKF